MKPTERMRKTLAGPEGVPRRRDQPRWGWRQSFAPLSAVPRLRDCGYSRKALSGPWPPKALDFDGTRTTPYPLLN
jgi:hypothetical protein